MFFINLLRGCKNECNVIYKLPGVININEKINPFNFTATKIILYVALYSIKASWNVVARSYIYLVSYK